MTYEARVMTYAARVMTYEARRKSMGGAVSLVRGTPLKGSGEGAQVVHIRRPPCACAPATCYPAHQRRDSLIDCVSELIERGVE